MSDKICKCEIVKWVRIKDKIKYAAFQRNINCMRFKKKKITDASELHNNLCKTFNLKFSANVTRLHYKIQFLAENKDTDMLSAKISQSNYN